MLDLFMVMGLPLIDESLGQLLEHMRNPPTNYLFSQMYAWARALGAIGALCVGGYEAWMMILARRGMDVMKLLRIWGLSMCITFSWLICSVLRAPGYYLESTTKQMTQTENAKLDLLQVQVAKKQKEYLDSLRSKQAQQEEQLEAQDNATDDGVLSNVKEWFKELRTSIENTAKEMAVVAESKLSELANAIIRFIGEVIFQMMYYGMFIGQRIFMSILALFAPIMFGLSVFPPWRNAWSQWVSKYVTLSLWGFIIYLVIYYIDYLLWCNLQSDLKAYEGLIGDKNINTGGSIGAFGIQAVGTTCIYIVGCLAGAKILGMVPEVASWLIPGGVSSSTGSSAAGVVSAAAGYAGVKAISGGGAVTNVAVKGGSKAVSTVATTSVHGIAGAVKGGYQGAKEGAQAGASLPGGPVAKTVMTTVGMIGGGAVGATVGGFKGAFQGGRGSKKSDDDTSSQSTSGGSSSSSSSGGSSSPSSSGGRGAKKSDDDTSSNSSSKK